MPERDTVYRCAYIPEHLPDYVQAISLAEPYIHEGYLCFFRHGVLLFIGYPLHAEPCEQTDEEIHVAIETACERFQPTAVSVIAPRVLPNGHAPSQTGDQYFRVDLPLTGISPDQAYMVRRARRELTVREGTFGQEHRALIETFINARDLSAAHQEIFRSIPRYLDHSPTARLLEARKGKELVAITILDLGSANYGFYVFNFRSTVSQVPGASDFLVHEMARIATEQGKRHLNLGLGVNEGIRRFKEKWGAIPFLSYHWTTLQRKRRGPFDIIRKILG